MPIYIPLVKSDVGDIGYYGNSEGLCGGGVSAVIGSDVDVHIANSVNTDFSS
jgi:hypothetical protein